MFSSFTSDTHTLPPQNTAAAATEVVARPRRGGDVGGGGSEGSGGDDASGASGASGAGGGGSAGSGGDG